uniref:Ras-associating domain-containing protein n=1 Tax=Panagrellus redivivus TaxID=6233 RepID=A0A7E4V1H3_PANRE
MLLPLLENRIYSTYYMRSPPSERLRLWNTDNTRPCFSFYYHSLINIDVIPAASIFASLLDNESAAPLDQKEQAELKAFERRLLAGGRSDDNDSEEDDSHDSGSLIDTSDVLSAMNVADSTAALRRQNANAQQQQQQLHHYPQHCSIDATGSDDLSALPPPPPALVDAASQLRGGAITADTPIVRCRPQVPPKPQIDLVRYSMANVNQDDDLDAILGELYELGMQLNSEEGANNLLMGITTLPAASSSSTVTSTTTTPLPAPAIQTRPMINASNGFIPERASTVKTDSNHSLARASPDEPLPPRVNTDFCTSPDVDSAFGDSSSTDCSSGDINRYRHSDFSSTDSYRGSLNTPSPSHQSSPKSVCASSTSSSNLSADLKTLKVKEALEKMKEANMKKIFIKIFLDDGSDKGILIDERWTVLETMKQLAEKLGITLTPEHSIIEEYPDLHIKRIYEDHEFVVENIEDWLADSKNKLHFTRRADKYNFVHHPQHFLLSEKSDFDLPPAESPEWNPELKQRLLKRFVDSAQVPELEGHLYLKQDGKKSWKKFYFALRSSGLYYCPKSKMKGMKDLQCLMNIYNNQIYTCTDWKKKYKAPTQYGFAIKHPKIQVKTSKYIKYVCTDDETTYMKWLTALRITRNSCATLYENYQNAAKLMVAPTSPIKVSVPAPDRLSSILQNAVIQRPVSTTSMSAPRSPARLSVTSKATMSSDHSSGMAFEQDDCGTIKRMPCDLMDGNATSMQRFAFANNAVAQTYMLRHSSSSSSGQSVSRMNPVQTVVEDDDSDEEHFPPPPEVVMPRTPTPQQVQLMSNRSSFASPVPPPSNVRPAQKPQMINLNPQNQTFHMQSPTGSTSSTIQANNRKAPPPPPPKRSENTRLVTAAPNGDLYTELQKVTALRRIEGN